MAESERVLASPGIFSQIWAGYRPYLVAITVDFLISTNLWIVLYFFKRLTKYLAIEGYAGDFIVGLHGAGAIAAFSVFATLFIIDLIHLHKRSRSRGKR